MLCVAFNQMLEGAGSNLMTPEETAALTPEIKEQRVTGSKWVFVSEHAMLLTIWSMKAAMLVLYARIMYDDQVLLYCSCTDKKCIVIDLLNANSCMRSLFGS